MIFRRKKDAGASEQAAEPAGVDLAAAGDPAATDSGLEPSRTTATEDIVYPTGLKLALILISVFISMFLVALDRLIVATALPQVTNDFNSVTDIGWYGSAYLLTTCAFQLLFGKLYTFYSIKGVFLTTVLLFEVGSAICGAAPSSIVFIIGRAIQGLAAGGLFSGVITIIVYAVPLHKRPLYQGLFGAVFGLASVIGPLLGGALTTNVSWRWCFYINLPFGAVAMLFVALLLKIPDRDTTKVPTKEKLLQLDFYGTGLLAPGSVCLLLALQWGGLTYPWNEGRIIALLVLAGVLLIGFVLVQAYMPKTATIAPRIFCQRSILAGFFSTLCIGSSMMIFIYFLPLYFQSIQGVSAVDSGIRTLPLVLAMVVTSMLTGIMVSRIGYYTPFMIVGSCVMAVGAGLLTTLEVDSVMWRWVVYQVVYGMGMGMTFQAPNLAAQTVLPNRDVPVGTSLMFFSQLLGGAIFISVGQNVLNNQLLERLSALPGFTPDRLKSAGATSLLADLPPEIKGPVLVAYNEALRKVFQVGLILVCLTVLGAVSMEWRSVKKNVQRPQSVDGRAESGEAATDTAAAAPIEAEKRAESDDERGTDVDAAKVAESEREETLEPTLESGSAIEKEARDPEKS